MTAPRAEPVALAVGEQAAQKQRGPHRAADQSSGTVAEVEPDHCHVVEVGPDPEELAR